MVSLPIRYFTARPSVLIKRLVQDILRNGSADDSPIDYGDVVDALRCARQRRLVKPGTFVASLELNRVVPVPMYDWARVANADIELLGLKASTVQLLMEVPIPYVGTLLLHSEEELAAWLPAAAMRDIRYCLRRNDLRLPTDVELAHAGELGFWLDIAPLQGRNLRMARELAVHLPIRGLFRLHTAGAQMPFFKSANIGTLGDLLALTEGALYLRWKLFITEGHISDNGIGPTTEAQRVQFDRGATANTKAVVACLEAAGLELAKR